MAERLGSVTKQPRQSPVAHAVLASDGHRRCVLTCATGAPMAVEVEAATAEAAEVEAAEVEAAEVEAAEVEAVPEVAGVA